MGLLEFKGNLFKAYCYLRTSSYPSSPEEERLNYTRFEKARIIGARALQLSMGAPCLLADLPKETIDPVDIAMREFDENAIPITVKRKETK